MKSLEDGLSTLVDKFADTNLDDGQALVDLYREFSALDKQFSERVPSYVDLLQMHAEESQLRSLWQSSAEDELAKRKLEIAAMLETIVLLETSNNPTSVAEAVETLKKALKVQDE